MLAFGSQRTFMIVCVLVLSAARVALGQALPVPAPVPGDSFRKPQFIRGDTNADPLYNIADAVYLLAFLFSNGPGLLCDDSGDANDDGLMNIGDAVYVLGSLFSNGPLPLSPHPGCGSDPTADSLGCASFPPCP